LLHCGGLKEHGQVSRSKKQRHKRYKTMKNGEKRRKHAAVSSIIPKPSSITSITSFLKKIHYRNKVKVLLHSLMKAYKNKQQRQMNKKFTSNIFLFLGFIFHITDQHKNFSYFFVFFE